jgi:uncharacterized cysteine cluster protein YcgN (CxxCxxCC family)/dihydrodipicolinate synthase/N-acetylneuraminate lyase
MTDGTRLEDIPFWRRKSLNEMTADEWDSLCDRCGRCCLGTLRADDTSELYFLDVGCKLQDPVTGGCSDYPNRKALVPTCIQLTPTNVGTLDQLPPTCGYVRVHRGQDLEWWHPLVSGDPNSVRAAGVSAAGRFVEPRFAGIMEYHTVDWPTQPATENPRGNWNKAMFGGITASVPTPFGADNRVDLDLMAEHCLWLLSNGCHGLAVLDKTGEVASLTIAERIAILEGLQSRGVPVSKLLAGIGAASLTDGLRIATRAYELGIRGVMLNISVPAKVLPRDVLSKSVLALIAAIPSRLHLYLSFLAPPAAATTCLTALGAILTEAPGRIRGIRDESPGSDLGIAALDHFGGYPFEVYTSEAAGLAQLTSRGGAGLIGPGANLLGLYCAAIVRGANPEQTAVMQRMIETVGRVMQPRPAVPAIKALIARHTGRPEWGRVRLPLRPTTPNDRMALFQSFDACGVKLRPATQAE